MAGISFLGNIPNTISYGTWLIALCSDMFFLCAASLTTKHHFTRLSHLSVRMCRLFSLTVWLFFFYQSFGWQCLGCTMDLPNLVLFAQFTHILALKFLSIVWTRMDGKPNIQNRFVRACATSLVHFLLLASSQEYLLKWSIIWGSHLCPNWLSQGKVLKSLYPLAHEQGNVLLLLDW